MRPFPIRDYIIPAAVFEVDVAWLAGLIEGEGWLSVHKNVYIRVGIQMTDRDVIDRVAKLWDAPVSCVDPKPPAKKPAYTTSITGMKAVRWIQRMYQFFGVRRKKQADKLLAVMRQRYDLAFAASQEVLRIRAAFSEGVSKDTISKQFNRSRRDLNRILSGDRWPVLTVFAW